MLIKFSTILIFDEPIDYLCDLKNTEKKSENISQKRILLYYRFIHNNKKYVYFKLEEHKMNSIHHVLNLLNKNRKDTYNKRRENEDKYETEEQKNCIGIDDKCPINISGNKCTLQNQDKIFYNKLLCEKIIKNISNNDYYDKNLRTGRELFINNELTDYLINKYYN